VPEKKALIIYVLPGSNEVMMHQTHRFGPSIDGLVSVRAQDVLLVNAVLVNTVPVYAFTLAMGTGKLPVLMEPRPNIIKLRNYPRLPPEENIEILFLSRIQAFDYFCRGHSCFSFKNSIKPTLFYNITKETIRELFIIESIL